MSGRTISHYKITEELGAGGMGVVYKAEDTKLERTVALKFLAAHLLEDEEGRARFIREAKAAAALDHQNICTVHEIDEVEGETFIAMAYIEGQTVKDKIGERPLKLDEALDIAAQTAQGLQAAHEKGVVHRDIKSANLMVTPRGQVKIMDFGLAQLAERSQLTKTATILGTPAYMSPEQTKRLPTDRRTDIWSLGVVIYEMVTGKLPFEGERQEAVLYAIGNEEPEPITALRAGLPMELEWIVGKAMAKDAGERYQHVEEIIVDLKSLTAKLTAGKSTILRAAAQGASPAARQDSTGTRSALSALRKRERLSWVLAAGLAVALFAALFLRQTPPPERPVSKWSFAPEALATRFPSVAVSPNGRHIAYIAGLDRPSLWVRDIDRVEPRRLAGTEGASWEPFWSPDSQLLGFTVGQELKKVSVEVGAPTTICRLPGGYLGGSWSPDGESIAFSSSGRIYEIPARGGQAELLFEREKTEKGRGNWYPHFLPLQARARSVVLPVGNFAAADVVLKNLETGESQVLAEGQFPVYSPSGHIVFEARVGGQRSLWALPFSPETLQSRGAAVPIAESARHPSVSKNGTLVFVELAGGGLEQLVWRDRDGNKLGEIGQPQQEILEPALSPDGGHVAVRGTESGNQDVWVHEVERPMKQRLTFDAAQDTRPRWSPSGREIAFQSARGGNYDIFRRAADGTGEVELLVGAEANERPYGWSRDGNHLLYTAQGDTGFDLWYLKRKDDGEGFESATFLETPFNEQAPQLSPDGRFLAYCSDASGEYQVYVRPFPSGDGQWQVSASGGCQPRWSHDSKELFYVEQDTLMAVEVRTSAAFATVSTTPLFSDPHLFVAVPIQVSYDVSADGHFVLVDTVESEEAKPPSIQVVENWFEEFRDR